MRSLTLILTCLIAGQPLPAQESRESSASVERRLSVFLRPRAGTAEPSPAGPLRAESAAQSATGESPGLLARARERLRPGRRNTKQTVDQEPPQTLTDADRRRAVFLKRPRSAPAPAGEAVPVSADSTAESVEQRRAIFLKRSTTTDAAASDDGVSEAQPVSLGFDDVTLGFDDSEAEDGSSAPPAAAVAPPPISTSHRTGPCRNTNRDCMVAPYLGRAAQFNEELEQAGDIPADYQPWWTQEMSGRFRPRSAALPVSLEDLILSSLTHSPTVLALKIDPVIRRRRIVVEEAEFDWLTFAEAAWDDTSDPVGNELTTGGPLRFRDNNARFDGGLRKRTRTGGQLELSTEYGWQDNNSEFFTPDPQGTSRLAISYTQPLWRESGTVYNESRIVLAKIDERISRDELAVQIQDHLVAVCEAYWNLFRSRAVLLQKQKLLARAQSILKRLEGRQGVDVLERQLLRARSAVTARRSEITRAATFVRNAESRLRLLVNDPVLTSGSSIELLPADAPSCNDSVYSTAETVRVALQTRPDISQAVREIRAQSVRCGIAKVDVLPRLDLILSTYVAGLERDGNVLKAFRNQFNEGEPGYSIGFRYEYPLGNRAAKARYEAAQFRVKKAFLEFQSTVETAMTEVEVAVREAHTAYRQMHTHYVAMQAAESEAGFLSERWRMLPGDDRTTAQLLEDLLDAQERVADEEFGFETARRNYMLSLVEIKRATGTLLSCDDCNRTLLQHGHHALPTGDDEDTDRDGVPPGPQTRADSTAGRPYED